MIEGGTGDLLRLAGAVHKLAQPHQIATPTIVRGRGRVIVKTWHLPLIVQLRNAIIPSGNGSGGGDSSAPNNRNVIDSDAAEKYQQLHDLINNAWTGLIPVLIALPKSWPLEHALNRWHLAFTTAIEAGSVPESVVNYASKAFSGWVRAIETKFDPPQMMTNNRPCPECAYEWVLDSQGDRRRAIVMAVSRIEKVHADCRVCGHQWAGEIELRMLASQQRHMVSMGASAPHPRHSFNDTPNESQLHETAELVIH